MIDCTGSQALVAYADSVDVTYEPIWNPAGIARGATDPAIVPFAYSRWSCIESPTIIASSTTQLLPTYRDWIFVSTVEVFLLSFIFIGLLYNTFRPNKHRDI